MLIIAQTALELGFLYALVAMALFLSYRTLDIADMTTDGCFVLGAAVSVTLAAAGHPFLAIPAAMAAGACAGYVTAFLQTRLGVPSILAGIVTNTGLYTVNLMAMGWKSNASLLGVDTIFSMLKKTQLFGDWYELVIAAGITLLAAVLLRLFLATRLGLSIRATGDNRDMVRASSLNPAFTVSVGLAISNALTALSGAMVGQYQGPERSAALAVAAPVWNIIYSLGLLMGIGGSVIFSMKRGANKTQNGSENQYFTAAVFGAVCLALVTWAGIWQFTAPLLRFFWHRCITASACAALSAAHPVCFSAVFVYKHSLRVCCQSY